MTNKLSRIIASVALFLLLSLPVFAAERQTLHGHVPALVKQFNLQPTGQLPATNLLYLSIGLPLRNPDAFSNQLAQLYDPHNANFHHWLTPNQIAQKFGPSTEDYEQVIAWAKTNGLTIDKTHTDHLLLRVQGSVADIEKTLHVKMELYQHPTENRKFYAPDGEPSIDLSVPLLHITGLFDFTTPQRKRPLKTPPRAPSADFTQGSGPTNSFWGNDFRNAYVPGTSLTGSGQVLGLLEGDDYYNNDIATYIKNSRITTSVVLTRVPVDGGVAEPGTNNTEVALDIEMAVAMAPGLSSLLVYEATNNGTYYVDILKKMQEDNLAKQLSSSFLVQVSGSGPDQNADVYYQLFAMQGQSFFQCSGDDGPYYQGIKEWADNPYVTIVGGTFLFTSTPGGPWGEENAWFDSGGGISASYLGNYSTPSYQQGLKTSLTNGSTTMRMVPDVAMVASGIYLVYSNGVIDQSGGTSAAAPLWAGFTALINEQAAANGQPTVGFLNPAIYAIGQDTNYDNCFHDITNGAANNFPCDKCPIVNNYAIAGYDLATGWGTPNGTNLINALIPLTGAVWVDFNSTATTQNGTYNTPYKTLGLGVTNVAAGGNIWIKTAGSSPQTLTITKPSVIRALTGPATIGN
jgi:subtilase family serine protease